MKVIKSIFNVLSIGCYLIIGVFALIELPMLFGYTPEIVLTGSMIPTYPINSVIYYKSTDFDSINVGDVITFDLGQSIVTHRVVQKDISSMKFTTQGDANPNPDQTPIEYNQVHGKVCSICIKHVGKLISILQNNIFADIVIVIILAIQYIISYLDNKPSKTLER